MTTHQDTTNPDTTPHWPVHVPPPGAGSWEKHAVNWLLDVCPHEYRGYAVLMRHPLALAHIARSHVIAQLRASAGLRGALRSRLTDAMDASALEDVMAAVLEEAERLEEALKAVDALGVALSRKAH